MFFSRLSLNKNIFFFFLMYTLGVVLSSISQANAFEDSSLRVASVEIKENASLTSSKGSDEKNTESEASISEGNGTFVQENRSQEQMAPEGQEKKTLKLWSMHQESADITPPVTVSTTNSTLSVLKKAQQHAKLLPVTNSTRLPGLNATFPVSLPPSNMPQLAPVTSW